MREVLMNEKTNLLQLEEHFYQLVDVDEPNTFRNLFPYSEVPKIAFNDRIVPHNMPEDIWITDTTFRDGQQSRAPYTTEQIVTIYDYLHKLGGPKGIIRQSEFFLYSKKDRDAVYKCLERGYKFPEVTSWIRASKKDFELVKDIGLKETGILVSCSDYHIFYKLKMTRKEALEHYLTVVRECMETGVRPRCHLEDITRSDIYGFVIPFCMELMKLMDEYKIPVKIHIHIIERPHTRKRLVYIDVIHIEGVFRQFQSTFHQKLRAVDHGMHENILSLAKMSGFLPGKYLVFRKIGAAHDFFMLHSLFLIHIISNEHIQHSVAAGNLS